MITDDELREMRERAERATPGPWHRGKHWLAVRTSPLSGGEALPGTSDDADFIAHARTDIPKLIAEVERLKAELQAVRRWLSVCVTLGRWVTPGEGSTAGWAEQVLEADDKVVKGEP